MPITRIFISYSHDSAAHRDFVLSLANQLRRDGLDCQIDQYVNGFPAQGWQRWMETQVEAADFVLLVCTPDYLKRFRGLERDGGRGVTFEGLVISQVLYDHYYRNTKFVAVIPEAGSLEDVPLPLKGFGVFRVMAEYEGVYRVLTDQPAVEVPPIGDVIELGQRTGMLTTGFDDLSTTQSENISELMAGFLREQTRNLQQKDDQIELLTRQLAELEKDRASALAENKVDQQNNPNNPLLLAEREALEAFDLLKAAEIREQYYFELKKERNEKILALQTEMAREAFTSASRWENAFNSSRALSLYQEAVEYRESYPEAWRAIGRVAGRLGRYSLALEAAQNLQKNLDPEKDKWWLAVAYSDEADALVALGQNSGALEKYLQTQEVFKELADAGPDELNRQRDLSVSHNKVGDMQLKTGDNVAALKAYEESLTIRQKLVELDPTHTEWQRDLSVSHNKVGDMQLKTGDNVAALKAYEDGLAIAQKLVELDPNVVEWQADLVVSYYKLAQLQPGKQQALLSDALAILKKLHSENKLDHEKQAWIPILEQVLE